jgi:hypothetical protein
MMQNQNQVATLLVEHSRDHTCQLIAVISDLDYGTHVYGILMYIYIYISLTKQLSLRAPQGYLKPPSNPYDKPSMSGAKIGQADLKKNPSST